MGGTGRGMPLFVIVVCDGGPLLPPFFKTYTQECTEGRKCKTHESRTPCWLSKHSFCFIFLVARVFPCTYLGCGENIPAHWNDPKALFISINNNAAGQRSSWTEINYNKWKSTDPQKRVTIKETSIISAKRGESWRNENLDGTVSTVKRSLWMTRGTKICFIQGVTSTDQPLPLSPKSKQTKRSSSTALKVNQQSQLIMTSENWNVGDVVFKIYSSQRWEDPHAALWGSGCQLI